MISFLGLFDPTVRLCPELKVPIKNYPASRVRLGAFDVDLRSGELYPSGVDGGRKTLLQEQPFQVLQMLIEGGGKVVTREEIKKSLWPNDTNVGFDHSINVAIGILRRTFGDSAENPQYIETLARRGYRLCVAIEWLETKAETLSPTTPVPSPPGVSLIGRKVSHYRVLEVIGGGGMGMVYKAEDLKLGRRVALKFLPEDLANDPLALKRFEREAQTASALNHPNICTIYGIEEYEGKPFIVMELLEGDALSNRLAQSHTPFALTTVLDIAVQVCSGLQAARAKGIIHRDIKPANIFLTKDRPVKILDFGLAKLASSEEEEPTAMPDDKSLPLSRSSQERPAQHSSFQDLPSLSATGTALGTFAYMSPEQIRKEKLDARTDLFSFGLVLYEMVTGRRAFQGESATAVREAILHHRPSSARELRPSVPRRLNEVISKALEKDRAQRYQSAMEMQEDLLRVQKESRSIGGLSPRNWLVIVSSLLILGTAGALYWRHHSGIALSSSDTLVLADVTNQTSDAALDEGLSFALLVALEQTPYLNLLGGDKLHETARRLGLSEDTKITPLVTPQVALQICRKTNSRAVVSASIRDVGNRFRIVLSAIDCESGRTLKQEVHEAETRDDIVRTLGLCAFQLRASLGESRDSLRRFNQPLDQATSSSPEALQFLVLGYEKQLRGDISGALSYYQRAEEKDPKFALAYAAHGSGLGWLEESDRALGSLSKAFELRDRLTIPSRFHVETLYYGTAHQQWDKELPIAQTWVQAFPHDIIARTNLRSSLTSLGRQNEALVQAREAARLLPSEPTLTNLLRTAIRAQRLDEARETYDGAKSSGFESLELHLQHALLAFLQNDKSGMQQEWAWASQDPVRGRFVLHLKSNTEVFYGHSRAAHRLALLNEESSGKAKLLSDAAIFESLDALREAEIGNLRLSLASVADAVQKSQDRRVLLIAAMAFARAGNNQESENLVERLTLLIPESFSIQAFSLPMTRAAIKLAEHDPAAAVELLRPVEPYDLVFADGFEYVYPAYLRGLAYLQLKQGGLAAAEFQKVLDHSGLGGGFVTGALAKLQLARAQVLTHDANSARKSYEDFLALWKNADPDIPIYRQAKTEYAQLRKRLT